MGDERGRNFSKLYSLIKSLSKKEKHQFWSFISSPSKRTEDGKYLQLFEFFAKAKSLQVHVAISKIFKGDQKAFNDCSRYLSIKILECLAKNDYGVHTEKVMIDKAIEKGFVKLAGNLLKKELSKAADKEDVVYLKDLMERHRKLYRYFGEKVKLPQGTPCTERIFRENAALAKSDLLYHQFVKLLGQDQNDRKAAHIAHQEEVMQLIEPQFFSGSKARLLKLQTLWHMLVRDFEGASSKHNFLLNIILSSPEQFPIEMMLEELSMGASFMIHNEKYEEAERILYELGGVESSSEAANRMATMSWIRNSLVLAACNGNVEIGKLALREYQKNEKSFPSHSRAFLYHASSILSFYIGDWEGVLEWQRKLSRMPEVFTPIHHMSFFVRAIASYELGMYSEVKILAQRMKSKVSQIDLKYPEMLMQLLEIILEEEFELPQSRLKTNRLIEEMNHLEGNLEEAPYFELFNASTWLQARFSDVSLAKFVLRENNPGLMKFRMTS